MTQNNLKEILDDTKKRVVVDKTFRLKKELVAIREAFMNSTHDSKVYAKIDFTSVPDRHYILTIKLKKGLFKFDHVLGNIFPKVAGGDKTNEINTYDVLLNRKLVGDDEKLPNLFRDAVQNAGAQFGAFHYRDTMEILVNNIVAVNESYFTTLVTD